jgi:hypothetical protein
MIEPEFRFVVREAFPKLELGQAESLEHTIDLAQKRLDQAIADISRQELHKTGSQTNPETLAERVREVWRREKVLEVITGLQGALGAAGKL